ncbi:hypothetical protein STEG23_015853, partial [Scotinomys teguina]
MHGSDYHLSSMNHEIRPSAPVGLFELSLIWIQYALHQLCALKELRNSAVLFMKRFLIELISIINILSNTSSDSTSPSALCCLSELFLFAYLFSKQCFIIASLECFACGIPGNHEENVWNHEEYVRAEREVVFVPMDVIPLSGI